MNKAKNPVGMDAALGNWNRTNQRQTIQSAMKLLRQIVLEISPYTVEHNLSAFRRGSLGMRERVEQTAYSFVEGYNRALEFDCPRQLAAQLETLPNEFRGFACEGAATALALLDILTPWHSPRVDELLIATDHAHSYMMHMGVGLAWARIPFGFRERKNMLHSVLGWLAYDGWGFHEGLSNSTRLPHVGAARRLQGYESRSFFQGLGRSLWFSQQGDVPCISHAIARFDLPRQPDLWSGIGLSVINAGVLNDRGLQELREKSGPFLPFLAQGAAFGAKVRSRAGNLSDYTDHASMMLCGLSAEAAVRVTDDALENLPSNSEVPAYEIWRQRIQTHFAASMEIHGTDLATPLRETEGATLVGIMEPACVAPFWRRFRTPSRI